MLKLKLIYNLTYTEVKKPRQSPIRWQKYIKKSTEFLNVNLIYFNFKKNYNQNVRAVAVLFTGDGIFLAFA